MEATINNLPDDVLLDVFKLLDTKSLKKASLVCSYWNKLISTSPRTMNNLVLRFRPECDMPLFEDILQSRRQYHSMEVNLFSSPEEADADEILKKLATRHGALVWKLTIRSAKLKSFELLGEVLEHFPVLTSLTLESVSFVNLSDTKVLLKFLKSLKLSDQTLVKHFDCPQVTQLALSGSSVTSDDLISFLKACDMLKSITFTRGNFIRALDHVKAFAFKLKTFNCRDCRGGVQDDQILIKFLESQASTLEKLELDAVSEALYGTIVMKLKRLKYLALDTSRLPDNERFYRNFRPHQSLREFKLNEYFERELMLKLVLMNFPCIQKVDQKASFLPKRLNYNFLEFLKFTAQNNPKVQRLPTLCNEPYLKSKYKFPCLTFLDLGHVKNTESLLRFFENNPTIEALSIQWVSEAQLDFQFFDEIIKFPSLKSLHVCGTFKTCKTIFNKAKSSDKNLEILEVEMFDGASKELKKLKVNFANRASVAKAGKIFQYANWNKYEKTQNGKVDTGDLYKRPETMLQALNAPVFSTVAV